MRGQTWDPDNDYHYPWQSGMTGIGVNKKTLAANNIPIPTKLADLWSIPADKVTFLTEARDTFGLGLLKLGIDPDPATVTDADLQAVADDIQPLVDKGLRFTGNEYLVDFAQKKVWAAFVWSGDLASSGSEDDEFIFPEEGTMIWTDNMLIPKGAVNKYTAEAHDGLRLRPGGRGTGRRLRLLRLTRSSARTRRSRRSIRAPRRTRCSSRRPRSSPSRRTSSSCPMSSRPR